MSTRSLITLLAVLSLSGVAARAEEEASEKMRTRNGGYLGIFVREREPGVVTVERVQAGSRIQGFRSGLRRQGNLAHLSCVSQPTDKRW